MMTSIKVAAITGIIAFAAGFLAGQDYANDQIAADTVKAFKDREKVNSNVQKLSDFDLCVALSGLYDGECAELRGVDKTTPNK